MAVKAIPEGYHSVRARPNSSTSLKRRSEERRPLECPRLLARSCMLRSKSAIQ